MWGGLHFFISIEALVSVVFIDAADLEGRAGRPYQKVIKTPDKSLLGVTAYPNTNLFLKTLRATGNSIHIISPWSRQYTGRILSIVDLALYAVDIRTIKPIPGLDCLTLSSIECDVSWYANSVLVVTDCGQWHPMLAPQVVVVDHAANARRSGQYTVTPQAAALSMELLSALCRCLTLAEWRVRYPGTAVSCCTALSTATLFSFCRFYVPPSLMSSRLGLLLNTHGATITNSEREATHVLHKVGGGSSLSSEQSSSATQSNSSDSEGLINSSSSDVGSSDNEEKSATFPGAVNPRGCTRLPLSASPVGLGPAVNTTTITAEDGGSPRGTERLSEPFAQPHELCPAASKIPATRNTYAVQVTEEWVDQCCSALRLLPVVPPTQMELAEFMRTTGALLAAILPPEDAKPLTFAQFAALAAVHQYDVSLLSGTISETQQQLTTYFGETVRSKPMVLDECTGQLTPPLSVQRRDANVILCLCRYERKRDRDAVVSHLQLIASQFTYSLDNAVKEHRKRHSQPAGTQTCSPLHATVAVGTEQASMVPETAEKSPIKQPAPRPLPPVTEVEDASNSTAAGTNDEEWRLHLKNVEGKMLRSQPKPLDVPPVKTPSTASQPYTAPPPRQYSSSLLPAPHMGLMPPPNGPQMWTGDGTGWPESQPQPYSPFNSWSGGQPTPRSSWGPPPPVPRGSIFPMPGGDSVSGAAGGSPAFLSASPPEALRPPSWASTEPARCMMATSHVPIPIVRNLFNFMANLPLFSTSRKTHVKLHKWIIECIFETWGEADKFLQMEYIQCDLGIFHIVPWGDPRADRPSPSTIATSKEGPAPPEAARAELPEKEPVPLPVARSTNALPAPSVPVRAGPSAPPSPVDLCAPPTGHQTASNHTVPEDSTEAKEREAAISQKLIHHSSEENTRDTKGDSYDTQYRKEARRRIQERHPSTSPPTGHSGKENKEHRKRCRSKEWHTSTGSRRRSRSRSRSTSRRRRMPQDERSKHKKEIRSERRTLSDYKRKGGGR